MLLSQNGVTASGGVIQICCNDNHFFDVLRLSIRLGTKYESSSLDAELFAAQTAVCATLQLLRTGDIVLEDNQIVLDGFLGFKGMSV